MKIKIPKLGKRKESKIRKEINDKIAEATEKYGELPPEEKRRIEDQVRKKRARRNELVALAATIGISAGAVPPAAKFIGEQQAMNRAKERQLRREIFKEHYGIELEPIEHPQRYAIEPEAEPDLTEKQINQLESKEDLVKYAKNLYIEQYELQTGDTTKTTDDIKIWEPMYENYIFKDLETGELITHGDYPGETRTKLDENGIIYQAIVEDTKVYKVTDSDNNTIDCITIQNVNGKLTPIKLTPGGQYQKNYNSILDDMGMVFPNVWEYYKHFGDEKAKQNLIQSIDELKEKNKLMYENDTKTTENELDER